MYHVSLSVFYTVFEHIKQQNI
uniref:Uncharacterized protein n=1 Tax=Anguilla anguilla TaxID=7936 RepID=A0A0E9XPR8_ANGAN